MKREYGSQGRFVTFAVQIPLLNIGQPHVSTLVVANDSYQRWLESNVKPPSTFMSNWGHVGTWSIGIADCAKFVSDPAGARGYRHVAGAREKRSVLIFSGNVDMFETDIGKVVDQLSSIAAAVAAEAGADFDGPHPISLYCGDRGYRFYKEETPVAKTA